MLKFRSTPRSIALLTFVAVVISVATNFADDKAAAPAAKAELIGAKKCIACHTKDGVGPSWQKGVHAGAWDSLTAEQQKDAKCAGCHTTGKLSTGEILTGVQCEACHGAGSLYKGMAIMKDRQKAIAAGMVIPTEETCKQCHNDKTPPECKAKPFDFKERVKKGVHAIPPKDTTKAK
jgi:hypothetical protein